MDDDVSIGSSRPEFFGMSDIGCDVKSINAGRPGPCRGDGVLQNEINWATVRMGRRNPDYRRALVATPTSPRMSRKTAQRLEVGTAMGAYSGPKSMSYRPVIVKVPSAT